MGMRFVGRWLGLFTIAGFTAGAVASCGSGNDQSTFNGGDDGSVDVWQCNKTPFRGRQELAEALELPEERITLHATHIGGDFGGKGSIMDVPIAYHLARKAGRPVTFDEIISVVWKGAPGTTNDAVRVHVGALRRKLEPDASNPRYLVTEPWIGYRFISEPLG